MKVKGGEVYPYDEREGKKPPCCQMWGENFSLFRSSVGCINPSGTEEDSRTPFSENALIAKNE